MLSKRQHHILTFLLERETFITIHHLAIQFNVSERTIQYDLEYIESMAQRLDLTISRNKNAGIMIKSKMPLNDIVPKYMATSIHYSKEERIRYIILKLFESNTPTSSKTLADMVSVTRRTIVEDLKNVQTWLSSYDLKLEYIKNKGFIIQGEETNYRKAYATRVHEYFQNHTHQIGHKLFSNKALETIRLTVVSVLFEADYQLVQSAIDGLIYHILIAIHRTKEKFVFEIPEMEYNKLAETDHFRVALLIKASLEEKLDIQFPKSEAGFITLHLLGAKTSEMNQKHETIDDLEILTEQLIERMSGDLGIDLINDTKLLNGLIVHLRPAIHRLKFDMTHNNPLADEILQQYHHIVERLRNHIWGVEENYHICFNKDELAYITLHFASAIERISAITTNAIKVVLLCGSGIGTSQLLRSRMRHIYPELEIVDAYSIYEIDETLLKHEGVDYIISTVPFEQASIPILNVSPFLDKNDRQQINTIINNSREQYVHDIKGLGPTLKEVLPENRILTQQPSLYRNDAIRQSIETLVDAQIVDCIYADEIIEQLDAFGPYMVISPHIALIHAQPTHVKGTVGFSITHYQKGIYFGHEQYDPVYIIITLATAQPQIHLNALRQLSELVMDDKTRKILLSGNIEAIMHCINEVSQH
ncbi:BglG family transcription antiterminator [Staphylococcus cohnii]|uniref:BglG family transcription antiterminator n=1 Tax=Staphylococcus cohnii TaxID=29382 RepID=UPI00374F60B3